MSFYDTDRLVSSESPFARYMTSLPEGLRVVAFEKLDAIALETLEADFRALPPEERVRTLVDLERRFCNECGETKSADPGFAHVCPDDDEFDEEND